MRLPDSFVLVLGLIVVAQGMSYLLPAGEFEREGRMVVADTYRPVEADPLPPETFLTAIPRGLAEAQEIIFFVFLIGGVVSVVRATGAVDALIGTAIQRLGTRPAWLVAGLVTLLAIGSATIGMAEEYLPFVSMLVSMCLALRLDAVVAVGIIYVGAAVGYACATVNPFTVLIAQDIAAVPLTSGQAARWALLVVCIAVGVHHILRYANRVHRDPQASLVADVEYSTGFSRPGDVRLTLCRVVVIGAVVAAVAGVVWGVAARGWYLTELSAVFLALGLAAAVVGGLGPNEAARHFLAGAAEMTTTALLIGFARTIQVVLTDARIIDTIVYGLAQPLAALPAGVAAIAMLAVQTICNVFIPSGSGQAYVTMPVMAPLADAIGLTRQTAVLAYQLGDGFTNMLVPTNALLMGMLALGRIPYQRWVVFVIPLLGKLYLVATAALLLAAYLRY